jgi:acyl-CoA thioester hydrolase
VQDFAITITPRFYETDALGHINNASIAAWFELVRMQFIASTGERAGEPATNWVLAALNIDFIAETFFGTDVIARVTDARAGNTSLTVVSEMSQEGKLTVRGKAVLVHLDAETRTPSPLPQALSGAFATR